MDCQGHALDSILALLLSASSGADAGKGLHSKGDARISACA
jgi:hypothetical protein